MCEERLFASKQYVYEFEFKHRAEYLDSALFVIREIEDQCPKWQNDIRMRKAEIYYLKQDYDSAITMFAEVDGGLPFSKFKNILIDKMKVKQAQIKGDSVLLKILYQEIVNNYEEYIQDTQFVFKWMLRRKDEHKVFFSWANTMLMEIFHYKLQLESLDNVIKEIDSLHKATKGNDEYFDHLKRIFIEDKDYHVFFE